MSGGQLDVLHTDPLDFYDLCEWSVNQPWSDGTAGLYGGSYGGQAQWRGLRSLSPHVRSMVPVAAAGPAECYQIGGIPSFLGVRWRYTVINRTKDWNLLGDTTLWYQRMLEAHMNGQGLEALATFTGTGWFGEPDCAHASETPPASGDTLYGPYIESVMRPSDYSAARDVAVLSVTGHYDFTQIGAIQYCREMDKHGTPEARRNAYLLIGPWNHQLIDGASVIGELLCDPGANVDVVALELAWHTWRLKAGPMPSILVNRVVYYVGGAEEWRHCDSVQALESGKRSLHLTSKGTASDIYHSGWLQEQPGECPADVFAIDIDEPSQRYVQLQRRVAALYGRSASGINFGDPLNDFQWILGCGADPTNPAYATDLCGQGVAYHSEPCMTEYELIGRPELQLFIRSDIPDADLIMLLYEVRANGDVIFLSAQALRLRFRNGIHPEPLPLDTPTEVVFRNAAYIFRRIAERSRLRLVVRALSALGAAPNLAARKAAGPDGRREPGRIEVLHDAVYSSQLHLPVAPLHPVVADAALAPFRR
jgi:predicted acyl esterase